MSGVAEVDREPTPEAAGRCDRHVTPLLLGTGTACAPISMAQTEIAERQARQWNLSGARLARFERIVAGSGIERRAAVRPFEEVMDATTAERMRVFEAEAPPLAGDAARMALADAGIAADAITDLVVVTCTGFTAPGVDVSLVERLGLRSDVRRLQVGFMGCFGAITGLRAARALAAADPEACVLLVCVELCSLHLRRDLDPQNLVASTLFADGAAAAVVGGASGRGDAARAALDATCRRLCDPGRSMLAPGTRDAMSWRITDHGFAMELSRAVPGAIRSSLRDEIDGAATIVPHPGGVAIIDAVESALADAAGDGRSFDGRGIAASRAVLRDHGNMSSPSVLFAFDRLALAEPSADAVPGRLRRGPVRPIAFGPGLSIESIDLT